MSLAGLIIAMAAAASGCGGSTAKPQGPVASASVKTSASPSSGLANGVPAQSSPSGYKWAGSTAQGVWFAVPRSWVSINLAKVNVTRAVSRLKLRAKPVHHHAHHRQSGAIPADVQQDRSHHPRPLNGHSFLGSTTSITWLEIVQHHLVSGRRFPRCKHSRRNIRTYISMNLTNARADGSVTGGDGTRRELAG